MNKDSNSIKTIIIVILVIAILFVWNKNSNKIINNDATYTIKLNNEPYSICGKEIYISNDSENNEINIDDIIENAEILCNFQKIETAKEEIEDLLDDDGSYTRNEILQHLQQIYYYLEDE